MNHVIKFSIEEEVECKAEIELCIASEGQGQYVWWDEDLNDVTIELNDVDFICKFDDMSDDFYQMMKEEVNDAVDRISLSDYKEIYYAHYESTLDI